MSNGNNLIVITAGSSGLVGLELTQQLLKANAVRHIYALSRNDLPLRDEKLDLIKHPHLDIQEWDETKPTPEYGFICLGTTRKQAGSNQGLERVDYELVCKVAQQMKVIGVKRLAVISSIGASVHAFSHYLRCKGKMEMAIERLKFEHATFMRPGPLVGARQQPRTDEQIVQIIISIFKPLMLGPLANFIPIQASAVAQSMQYSVFGHSNKKVQLLDSIAMRQLIQQYQ